MTPIALFEHQMYVLGKSIDEKSYAFFMETGTGKTIVTIETIKYLWDRNKINFVIILAPKLVCESVWEVELERYREDIKYRLFKWIGGMSNTDKYIINSIIKAITEERKFTPILPIFLINTEAFSHVKIYNLVIEIIKKAVVMMVIDESTSIKNPKAQRTKGLLKLADSIPYKRILSGYPILRSPEDLYTQIRFLGKNLIPYQSFFAFRNEFCTLRAMGRFTIVTQYKNLDKLAKLISPFSIRITKKECLDLPDKVRTKRYVTMTPLQQTMYTSMKEECYLHLTGCEESVFALSFLAQLSKLHQIANGLLIRENTEIPNIKYDALIEILHEEIPDQCVIWFWFIRTLEQADERIRKKFGKDSTVIIHGNVPFTTRMENLRKFQTGKVRFLLANPATAMHGLNLVNCNYVIYFNNSTHLEHRVQSEDRFHRIGQINKVTYIDLITKNTVEDRILKQLENNHKIGAEVLKDKWEDWFR